MYASAAFVCASCFCCYVSFFYDFFLCPPPPPPGGLTVVSLSVQAKPTHGDIIRLAPPLVITEEQIMECVGIFRDALAAFQK